MVQFNLLPDIKIQYLQAKRQKHLMLLVSVGTIIVSVTFLVIMVSAVFVVQKKSLSDLSRDINSAAHELQSTPDLTKMLTVQNQLKVLPSLHDEKRVASRIFDYIAQSTPTQADISRLHVDFVENSVTISGSAKSLVTVNTFTDTLKFAMYTTKNAPEDDKPAFSSVVLSSFGRDNEGASYTINLVFDPVIFAGTEEVTLTVPKNKVTTRSQIETPPALFNGPEQEGEE